MKQLAKALDLVYSGELVSGVTTILVVAREPWEIMHEAAIGLKGKTGMLWENMSRVRHHWLGDSTQRC